MNYDKKSNALYYMMPALLITCRLIQPLTTRPVFWSHARVTLRASFWDSAQLWQHMLMLALPTMPVSNGELLICAVCVFITLLLNYG